MRSLTSVNQLADTVLKTLPATYPFARPTSAENTGRMQPTNDGRDVQRRTLALSSQNLYKTQMHSQFYKIGQIVFLFPVLAHGWSDGKNS